MPSKKSSRNNPKKETKNETKPQFKIINCKLIREQSKNIHQDRKKNLGEIAYCYNRRMKNMTFINKKVMKEQMEIWKKQKDTIMVQEANNGEKEIEGRTMYYFTLQQKDKNGDFENIGIDPYAAAQGYYVDGLVYFYYDIKNRDMVFNYMYKITNN